jgi:hypothetical protein
MLSFVLLSSAFFLFSFFFLPIFPFIHFSPVRSRFPSSFFSFSCFFNSSFFSPFSVPLLPSLFICICVHNFLSNPLRTFKIRVQLSCIWTRLSGARKRHAASWHWWNSSDRPDAHIALRHEVTLQGQSTGYCPELYGNHSLLRHEFTFLVLFWSLFYVKSGLIASYNLQQIHGHSLLQPTRHDTTRQ